MKDTARRQEDFDLAADIRQCLKDNQPRKSCLSLTLCRAVPDVNIMELVRERLNKPDCRVNGWILEGCPQDVAQIRQLQEMQITPQVVVAFEMSDQAVFDQCGEEKRAAMEKRLNDYRDFLGAAETEYSKFLIRINSEESSERIFLNFCDALENSVLSATPAQQ